MLSITQGCVSSFCSSNLPEVDLIGLAVVGVLCYKLLRSAASGVVELDVAAGLSCSVGNCYVAA